MSSIAAASVRVRGGVWFVFIIVTLIQFIGNIYFCYKETDVTSQDFKDWVELTSPVFEAIGSDIKDTIAQRRWLALLEGGLLPLISLASLHFFIRYGGIDDEKTEANTTPTPISPTTEPIEILDSPSNNNDTPEIEEPKIEVVEEKIEEKPTIPKTNDIFPANRDEVMSKHFHNRINGTDKWS
jgi:hypothetical protein